MKKKLLGLSLVCAVFAGVLGVALSVREGGRGSAEVSLAELNVGEIDELVVRGKNPVRLLKRGGRWELETGRPAEPRAVYRALESLKKIESTHQLASTLEEGGMKRWGLGEEDGTFVTALRGGRAVVEFGVGPVEGARAPVAINGAVYAVKGIYPGVYSRPLLAWVKKRLFDFGSDRIREVKVERAGDEPFRVVSGERGVTLERAGDAPGEVAFDPEVGEALFAALSGLRVKGYVKDEKGTEVRAGETGTVRLTLRLKSDAGTGPVHTLLMGAPGRARDVLLRWVEQKTTVRIDAAVARVLGKRVGNYRSFPLMTFDPTTVVEFKLYNSTEYLYFTREKESWTLVDSFPERPEDFKLEPALVSARLSEMAGAKAEAVAGPKRGTRPRFLKEGGPRLVAISGSGETYELYFGARFKGAEGEGWYARGDVDSRVYTVPGLLRKKMLRGLDSFQVRARRAVNGGGKRLDPAILNKFPPEIRERLIKQLQSQAER